MSKKIMFSDLNARVQGIFGNEDNFEGYKNLIFDVANGVTVYDEEGNVIDKKSADKKIRKFVYEILGINETSSKRDRKRAMKKHGDELFEVIEDVIDFKVETGFKESEFFNQFVEERNIKRGDSQEFWTDEDVILSVVKVAGDHHDFNSSRVRIA